jgi:phospholipid/cholesterol/gamma-HCH transport system substrate-binding protein
MPIAPRWCRIISRRYRSVIRGNGTQLAKLFQDIPTITKQVVEITTKLNTLLDEKNMGRMGDTLANIEKLTRDLNGLLSEQNVANAGSAIANANTTMENFSAFSQDAKEIVTRFEKTADEIESTVKSLNTVITNSQKSIGKFSSEGLDQLTATTRAAERMIESIREIADKLGQDPSQILYKPQNQGVEIPQ